MYREDESIQLVELIVLIEKVVSSRNLDRYFHREEIEKIFFNILDGQDKLNPYDRRDCGIDDDTWHEKIKNALYFLNLRKSYDKIYKS